MDNKIKTTIAFLLVFFFLDFSLISYQENEQRKIFQLKGRTYRLEAHKSNEANKIDILLHGEIKKNLSQDFSGYNILPTIEVSGDHFYVSWINLKSGYESLCFYDSYQDTSRIIISGGFNFSGSGTKIIFDGALPEILIFKAKDSDNYDLFCYSFKSGEVKNITYTPENETSFYVIVNEKKGNVFIETESLYHRYKYLFDTKAVKARLIVAEEIIRKLPDKWKYLVPEALNTYIAFGDSITWGKMRMNDFPYDPNNEYHHPELAYPQKIQEMLEPDYGALPYYNLGVPGETALGGALRVYEELFMYPAKYFLLMLGTNDAFHKDFQLGDCLKNLEDIVDAALSYDMNVVISTIPPRNDHFWHDLPWKSWVIPNIEALNAGILALADAKNIRYIDTYAAFMNYNPPDGWQMLLEDRDASDVYVPGRGGQHPSPLGHQVIAELFVPRILKFAPAKPEDIVIKKMGTNFIRIRWSKNQEFDFSHYIVEFGYFPGNLGHSVNTYATYFNFIHPPFLFSHRSRVYFRLRAVDHGGNISKPTLTYSSDFD